jgi:hypothetical protein
MKSFGNIAKDGQVKAVASGALTNGSPVIVNSDGTVSLITGGDVSQAVGSATVFETGATDLNSIAYDANAQKVVVAYQDSGNSSQGTAVVGTVSGTSISFGSPVVFETGNTSDIKIVYDENAQKVVIFYRDGGNSNRGTAIVGTVSGTSISFGTAVVFNTANTTPITAAYDVNAQKTAVGWYDALSGEFETIVGTVSGTSISFGSMVTAYSGRPDELGAVYDANAQKVVFVYKDVGNSNYGTAIVGTISGTSISFGDSAVYETADSRNNRAAYDSNAQKVVIAYKDVGNSSKGTAIVGTISGTSITFGTPVIFNDASTNRHDITYDANAQKIVIAFVDGSNSNYGAAISGLVSGTSITFDTKATFENAEIDHPACAYDSSENKVAIAYADEGNSSQGTSVIFQAGFNNLTLTSENFIGFSDGVFADTQSATINTTNTIDRNQSSLTAGQTYFVQGDGTIGLTADDPSVTAGTAISATELIVKG